MAREHETGREGDGSIPNKPGDNNFWIVELAILIHRAWLQTVRDKMKVRARLGQTIVMALIAGLLYLNLKKNQESIQDRIGLLFFAIMSCLMPAMMSILTLFPSEKLVFIKEYASGAYGSLTYFLAKVITEGPFNFGIPFIYSIIVYFMTGLRQDEGMIHFGIFYLTLILVSNGATAIGLVISTSISNLNIALLVSPLVFIPMMLFGGFFANNDSIPAWLSWIQYLSLFKYSFETLMTNEFLGLDFSCTSSKSSLPPAPRFPTPLPPPSHRCIPVPGVSAIPSIPCLSTFLCPHIHS